jgi:hypothetical protein
MRRSGDSHPRAHQIPDHELLEMEQDSRDRRALTGAAVAAGASVLMAILAILASAAVPSPDAAAASRGSGQGGTWGGTNARARQSLVAFDSGGLSSGGVSSHVQAGSQRYVASRTRQIRREIAQIDSNPWRTAEDIKRRLALASELSRLSR